MRGSSFAVDPEVVAAVAAVGSGEGTAQGSPTWRSLRAQIDGFYRHASTLVPAHPQVTREVLSTRADDGAEIALHWFTSPDAGRAAVVHAHGGGRIAGQVDLFAPYLVDYVARSRVSFLSVEYRLAPEAGHETPVRDVFAGLRWLAEQAEGRGVDPHRIAVMRDSAGGGLAAGAALLARRNAVPLAGQLLVYPMLDDRVAHADAALAPFAEWVVTAAEVGWNASLGSERGGDGVSELAAPARATDLTGLPRTYLEVGELDLFRDQSVDYAHRLWRAGVSTELHVLPGGTHGYDHWAPYGALARRVMEARVRFLESL